jgi:small subunit ribosomal protein S13
MYIFDSIIPYRDKIYSLNERKYFKEKRLETALLYCLGIGKTQSRRIIAKIGINRIKKLNDKGFNLKLKKNLSLLLYEFVKKSLKIRVSLEYMQFCRQKFGELKESKCYKAIRHTHFLPVRGQRTKTNAKTQKFLRKNKNRNTRPIPKKKK